MFYKKDVLRNFAIFTGKHLCQSLLLSCNFIKKETLSQGFSCEFFKIQSFIVIIWEKNSSIYLRKIHPLSIYLFFPFFPFFVFSFSLTNACLLCQLRKAYAVLRAANRFVGSETSKHNDFGQETHNFLVLTDAVIICIY